MIRVVINPKKEKHFLKFLKKSKYFSQYEIIRSSDRYIKFEITTVGLTNDKIWKKLFKFTIKSSKNSWRGKIIFRIYFQDEHHYYY